MPSRMGGSEESRGRFHHRLHFANRPPEFGVVSMLASVPQTMDSPLCLVFFFSLEVGIDCRFSQIACCSAERMSEAMSRARKNKTHQCHFQA